MSFQLSLPSLFKPIPKSSELLSDFGHKVVTVLLPVPLYISAPLFTSVIKYPLKTTHAMANFGSQFDQTQSVMAGKALAAGARTGWSHHICPQEAGSDEYRCSAHFLLFVFLLRTGPMSTGW